MRDEHIRKNINNELDITKRAAALFARDNILAKMKYPVVATLAGQGLAVTRVCKLLGLSRSGFYAWTNELHASSHQTQVSEENQHRFR